MNAQVQLDTKVISARIPVEEACRIDELAQTAGLSRNDFIRMRLKAESLFIDIEELLQLIEALRQVEKALDSYLSQLERLLDAVEDIEYREETVSLIIDEIANAKALMSLVFKSQKQTARVIRAIRQKVESPLLPVSAING